MKKGMENALKNKILEKKAKIGIIGLGYVGLPLAVEFAKKGFEVVGIDIDKQRVDSICKKKSYILDVTSEDIKATSDAGLLEATNDYRIVKKLDAIIICVPTPLRKTKEPDISYIVNAVENIAKYGRKGQLVVLESTTYPGTTDEAVLPILEKGGFKLDRDFFLAFSPERVDPANIKYKTRDIPKVVGGVTKKSAELTKLLYGQIIKNITIVSSAKTAEMVKLLENTFRSVNIGLVNELALMCDKLGINVWEVIDAAKTKPFGFMPFYPGPGLGGHCLGQDEFIFARINGRLETLCVKDFEKQVALQKPAEILKANGITLINPTGVDILSFDIKTGKPCYQPIRHFFIRRYNGPLVKIKTEDNRIITLTDKHPHLVYSNKPEIKFAKDITKGERLLVLDKDIRRKLREKTFNLDKKFALVRVKDVAVYSSNTNVYSVEVEKTNTFVTSYGLITHNCIPIDPLYLSWKARAHGFEARFIELADMVNSYMPEYIVKRTAVILNKIKKPLSGSRILIVGVTYKRDVNDIRESPAMEIIRFFKKDGADISYFDPYVPEIEIDGEKLKSLKWNPAAFKNKDCVIIVTDHSSIDYEEILKNSRIVFDTRNIYKSVNAKNLERL